jgi:hypothetical protein
MLIQRLPAREITYVAIEPDRSPKSSLLAKILRKRVFSIIVAADAKLMGWTAPRFDNGLNGP